MKEINENSQALKKRQSGNKNNEKIQFSLCHFMQKTVILWIWLLLSNVAYGSEITITDINNHWAKDNITRMLVNEKMNGYPDHTFRPDNEVTTLEFLKILFATLEIPIEEQNLYAWPEDYIATAQKYGLIYDYEKPLTRYEATEIIVQLLDTKSITTGSNPFQDLDAMHKKEVLKLVKLKIINGYEDHTFRGENGLTRAEAVTIALRVQEAHRKIIQGKKYEIASQYTNVNRDAAEGSLINKNRYEIQKQQIYFYDTGRFAYLDGHSIEEKYVTNQKIIHILENLVSENSYTALYYVPSPYTINQIIVKYGANEMAVYRNLDYFSMTYYEEKRYDLGRDALKEQFSHECFGKLTVKKLWTERYEMEQGNYVDVGIQDKLFQMLKVEFGKNAEAILSYVVTAYQNQMVSQEEIAEQTKIGKYLINTYKTDATSLEFYFEKLSS